MSALPRPSILLRLPACGSVVLEPAVEKKHPRIVSDLRVFSSGDVLLSHDLSSHYHRGCSVSLPCSEWERVVPLRYNHQSSRPEWLSDASHRRPFGPEIW